MSRARHKLTSQRQQNLDGQNKVVTDEGSEGQKRVAIIWPTSQVVFGSFNRELWELGGYGRRQTTSILKIGSSNQYNFPSYVPYLLGGGVSGSGMKYYWHAPPSATNTTNCWTNTPGGAGKVWSRHGETVPEADATYFYLSFVSDDGDDNEITLREDWFRPAYPHYGTKFSLRVFSGNDWIKWEECYIEEVCEDGDGGDAGYAKIKVSSDNLTTSSGLPGNFSASRTSGDEVRVRVAGNIIDLQNHQCHPDQGDLDILGADGATQAGFTASERLDQPSFAHHDILYWNLVGGTGYQNWPGITWSADGYSGGADSSCIINAELHFTVSAYLGIWYDPVGFAPPRSVGDGNFSPNWNKSVKGFGEGERRNVGGDERFYDANFFVRGVKQLGLTWDGCMGMTNSAAGYDCTTWKGFWRPNWMQIAGMSSGAASAGVAWAQAGGIGQGTDITTVAEGNADFNAFEINGIEPPMGEGAYSLNNPFWSPTGHIHTTLNVTDIVRQQHDQNGGYVSIMMGLCGDHLCHGQSYDHEDWIKSHAGLISTKSWTGSGYSKWPYLKLTYIAYV